MILAAPVRDLDPETEYLLLADDLERARLTTDASGNGTLLLRHPPLAGGGQALDFDPRGQRIELRRRISIPSTLYLHGLLPDE